MGMAKQGEVVRGTTYPRLGLRAAWSKGRFRVVALGVLGLLAFVFTVVLVLRQPFPLANQPFPDAHEYLNAANRLAHGHGYTTTVRDNSFAHLGRSVNPPRYPPGTSLVLAPFALFGHYPGNIEFGSRLIVVALVIAAGWAAFVIAGWYAALFTAFVTSLSEFALISTRVVMSDALAALLIVVAIPLMKVHKSWSVYALGLLAGYGVVIREGGVIVVACLLVVMAGWDRLRVAVGAALPILGLAIFNWVTFGAPWNTGYGYWLGKFPEYSLRYVLKQPWPAGGEEGYFAEYLHLFHLVGYTNSGVVGVLPNLWFYPLILLGCSAVFGPPLFTSIGLIATARWWRRREARFTLLLAALSVVFYMPNYAQDPRFLAGPCILLTAWASAAFVYVARFIRARYGAQIATYLFPNGAVGIRS
jgi:hypothetical protein